MTSVLMGRLENELLKIYHNYFVKTVDYLYL